MSERAAAIEAAALEVAAQLAEKQRELNRRRRAAALAAKAALVEQMKASIAEIDTEILVCLMLRTGTTRQAAKYVPGIFIKCDEAKNYQGMMVLPLHSCCCVSCCLACHFWLADASRCKGDRR